MIPVDAKGNVIEGIKGMMHPDVLQYMADVGPRREGDYLFFANAGRLRYTLSEECDLEERTTLKKIEIFDPAMCCSTGVCGPSIDPELLRVATVISTLQERGASIRRHNLASEPQDFVANKTIAGILEKEGADVLPVTLVDGEVARKKAYPTNVEFAAWTGIVVETESPERATGGT